MRISGLSSDLCSSDLHAHVAVDPPETRPLALLAQVGHDPHAHAHTEDRHALAQNLLVERLAHAGFLQQFHRVAERADARQDDSSRVLQVIRILRDLNLNPKPLINVRESQNVTEAVLDDLYHLNTRLSKPRSL